MTSDNRGYKDNDFIETCPDSHHCRNGSKCVPNPYDEGAYYCDCDEVIWEAAYEGLYCEHKADVYCSADGVKSHSFCTNGGTCVDIVQAHQAHIDCDCPSGYEGSFCQFVSGTKPENWPYTNNLPKASKKSGGSAHIVAGFVLTLTLLIIIGAFAHAWRRKDREHLIEEHRLTGNDLHLEPNGGNLKLAVEDKLNQQPPQPRLFTAEGQDNESGISLSQADKSMTDDSMFSIT